MPTLMSFLLRLFLVLAGLVFGASLAVAFALLVILSAMRTGWARLTGRPAAPIIIGIDPRGGFDRMVRRAGRGPSMGRGSRGVHLRPGVADVTDVEARPPSR